jgi:hypothetical protein
MHSLTPAAVPAAVTTKRSGAIPKATRYAIIGNGWRSSVFVRMAYLMPERFGLVGVVTRQAEAGAALERDWGVATHRTIDDLLVAERPDFVVLCVPWRVTPELTRQLVRAKVGVLAETPPAPDLDGLRSLWADVGASGLVQVAEQYALMPLHAARLQIAQRPDRNPDLGAGELHSPLPRRLDHPALPRRHLRAGHRVLTNLPEPTRRPHHAGRLDP